MTGWREHYEVLAKARYGALLAYATLLAGSRPAAEDLLHDSLVRVFGRPRRFDDADHAEGYVRVTMARLAMDRARGSARMYRAFGRTAERPVVPDPAGEVDARESVASALAVLPPQVRACMVLRYFDDLPVAVVAERLGIAEGTAKRYLADGRSALAGQLDVTEPADTLPVTPGRGRIR